MTGLDRGTTEGPTVAELLDEARDVAALDLGRARALVQQARVLARAAGDLHGEAEALYRIAELAYASGMSNEAFAVALEARDQASACGATKTVVSALNLIAAVQYHAANYSEALASAIAALELYRSTGERASEGMLLNSLAVIQHSLRDTDRALVTYEAALMANKGEDRPDLDAITLANMAKVRAERREHLLAVSLGESALELARVHAAEFVPEILARLAIEYVALAAHDRAAHALDEADTVLRDRADHQQALSPASAVMVRTARGDLLASEGRRDDALREWSTGLELAADGDLSELALELRVKLAELNKSLGRYEEALRHQEERFALNAQIFDRGTDLRIKTLQIQHDTESARQQAEILRLRTSELESMVQARTDEIERGVVDAFVRVALSAERVADERSEHPTRVGELVGAMAVELGVESAVAQRMALAARVHDIGKVVVPETVLRKPAPLDDEELAAMRVHTTRGAEILASASSPVMQLAAAAALCHHERWDGSGYPRGLVAEEIPLVARLVAVADVYDSLVTDRVYDAAWPVGEAVRHVVEHRGTHFEPRVVDALLRVLASGESPAATPAAAALRRLDPTSGVDGSWRESA